MALDPRGFGVRIRSVDDKSKHVLLGLISSKTPVGAVLLFGCLLLWAGGRDVAGAEPPVYRFVVDFGVTCHSAADPNSPVGHALPIAASFRTDARVENGGVSWYSSPDWVTTQNPSCWVFGPNTIEGNEADSLPPWLAMLDHQLARTDVSFEQYVALDNLLSDSDRRAYRDGKLATSGLLQFKMLQLLERAIHSPQGDDEIIEAEPFKKAWMLAHTTLVGHSEYGGGWYVRAKPYWDIYERNRHAVWADDLAWIASQHTPPTDDCMSDCVLQAHIIDGPLQYWSRLPLGRHVAEAIRDAAGMAEYSAGLACYDHVGGPPGQSHQSPVSKALVRKIRQSLLRVVDSGKMDILNYLDEAERKCAN